MPLDKFLSQVTSSPSAKGALSGAASGALVSLLMNKKARKKIGSGAIKVGGAAALAGAGFYAYKKWQQHQAKPDMAVSAEAVAGRTPPPALEEPERMPVLSDSFAMTLIEAMMAAASSDGHIDDAEMDTLLQAIEQAGLTPEENRHLTATLNEPPSVEALASKVSTETEAAELYAAAAAAIHIDNPAENLFLRRLARALALDDALVATLRSQ